MQDFKKQFQVVTIDGIKICKGYTQATQLALELTRAGIWARIIVDFLNVENEAPKQLTGNP